MPKTKRVRRKETRAFNATLIGPFRGRTDAATLLTGDRLLKLPAFAFYTFVYKYPRSINEVEHVYVRACGPARRAHARPTCVALSFVANATGQPPL